MVVPTKFDSIHLDFGVANFMEAISILILGLLISWQPSDFVITMPVIPRKQGNGSRYFRRGGISFPDR